MKKLFASLLLTSALLFSPVGNVVFQDHATITVEAKKYKSGKKNFKPSTNNNNNSNFQNQKNDSVSTNKATTQSKGGFFSGGLMKGLMLGGLAGLLFGSLFANMGMLGSILGFIINVLAIVVLIAVVRKIFVMIKEKKKKEETNTWRNS